MTDRSSTVEQAADNRPTRGSTPPDPTTEAAELIEATTAIACLDHMRAWIKWVAVRNDARANLCNLAKLSAEQDAWSRVNLTHMTAERLVREFDTGGAK